VCERERERETLNFLIYYSIPLPPPSLRDRREQWDALAAESESYVMRSPYSRYAFSICMMLDFYFYTLCMMLDFYFYTLLLPVPPLDSGLATTERRPRGLLRLRELRLTELSLRESLRAL